MNREAKIFRYLEISIALMICVIAVICWIPIPVHIECDAIEIKLDDPNYIMDRRIAIHGQYFINLMEDSSFQGNISISGLTDRSEELLKVSIAEDYKENGATLWYRLNSENSEIPLDHCLGIIFSNAFFSDPCILLYDNGTWTTMDGYCIVSRANNREDALKKLQQKGIIYGTL